MLSSDPDQAVAPLRKLCLMMAQEKKLTECSANLARSGHSVFLIEAGEDAGDNRIEQVPAW